jgi:hypothetical protein
MRLGKTLSALLLIVLWLSHGFLACRAVQSFPGDSTTVVASHVNISHCQTKHSSVLVATQPRPILARSGADQAAPPIFPVSRESGLAVRPVRLSAIATTLAPPNLAVTWQFACRAALFPRNPS